MQTWNPSATIFHVKFPFVLTGVEPTGHRVNSCKNGGEIRRKKMRSNNQNSRKNGGEMNRMGEKFS